MQSRIADSAAAQRRPRADYAQLQLASGEKEHLAEGYYNFQLTERLRLSFHLTHVLDKPDADTRFGYLLPGIRFQAAF